MVIPEESGPTTIKDPQFGAKCVKKDDVCCTHTWDWLNTNDPPGSGKIPSPSQALFICDPGSVCCFDECAKPPVTSCCKDPAGKIVKCENQEVCCPSMDLAAGATKKCCEKGKACCGKNCCDKKTQCCAGAEGANTSAKGCCKGDNVCCEQPKAGDSTAPVPGLCCPSQIQCCPTSTAETKCCDKADPPRNCCQEFDPERIKEFGKPGEKDGCCPFNSECCPEAGGCCGESEQCCPHSRPPGGPFPNVACIPSDHKCCVRQLIGHGPNQQPIYSEPWACFPGQNCCVIPGLDSSLWCIPEDLECCPGAPGVGNWRNTCPKGWECCPPISGGCLSPQSGYECCPGSRAHQIKDSNGNIITVPRNVCLKPEYRCMIPPGGRIGQCVPNPFAPPPPWVP